MSFEEEAGGLRLTNIVRTFDKGAFRALDGVSLSVGPGQILGLVGPNGAGKTTLVRICATLLTPDSGQVLVGGVDAVSSPKAARSGLGVVFGGEQGFYPRASVRDNLLFFADVAGVGRARRQQVDWALEQVGLSGRAGNRVNELSRGMKQRLHIARAILGRPSVLLLDEPTSGLDPEIAAEIRALIRRVAEAGAAILLTSHTMSEVEALASRVAVIGAGRILVAGSVSDVAREAGISSVSAFTVAVFDDSLRQAIEALRPTSINTENQEGQVAVRLMWGPPSDGSDRADVAAAGLGESDPGQAVRRLLAARPEGLPADFVHRPPTLEEDYLGLAPRLVRP